jgi:hypothetical protein
LWLTINNCGAKVIKIGIRKERERKEDKVFNFAFSANNLD